MNIPFLGNRSKKYRAAVLAEDDPEGIAELLSECELLRSQVARERIRLDDTAASLEALDQLPPRWREDEETLPWFGHDAGLYLGTVVVRTVPGAVWVIGADGEPVVRLVSGREVDVVTAGRDWAATGTPELSQLYAEVAEN
ncbi:MULTISPECIES: DUF6278 family protein [Streptomyces]|uniref:Prevent-host-death family protein n=1 Tax=Streptomyces asoensis TaxID=249586 RepID=A0ABQ3S8F8_9ACTN|nr:MULTISPECIES: DUF6278 family protein [Streptomyces]MBK3624466.1 hypothetical protein [Streptomyces sp. MBT49]MBK3635494.1 hypothetical protein [Streptomyces sp. MBT97]GGQ83659.1 hypothetical protein GCM10010496_54190 [Streptomyces asoensis]GHI64418.1 hypothetical protein Saso_60680 [Streptomyces asoensis]